MRFGVFPFGQCGFLLCILVDVHVLL